MSWIYDHTLLTATWFVLALACSIYWGIYGIYSAINEKDEKGNKVEWQDGECLRRSGYFLSEFIGSFAGWGCLFILLVRHYATTGISIQTVDLFLILGAAIGMAGYLYWIPNNWRK